MGFSSDSGLGLKPSWDKLFHLTCSHPLTGKQIWAEGMRSHSKLHETVERKICIIEATRFVVIVVVGVGNTHTHQDWEGPPHLVPAPPLSEGHEERLRGRNPSLLSL